MSWLRVKVDAVQVQPDFFEPTHNRAAQDLVRIAATATFHVAGKAGYAAEQVAERRRFFTRNLLIQVANLSFMGHKLLVWSKTVGW